MKVKVQLLLFICLTTLNGQVDYTSQIQTIFTNNCTGCHSYGNASGGLNLTAYSSVMAGGNSGAVIVANDHANSLLWQKVNTGAMPQDNTALPQSQIDLIALWINEGALEFPAVVEKTYVPDDNFEQALIDLGYDDALDDSVLTANISSVTTLNVSNDSISDLTGIENFTALTNLHCSYNQLTSLDMSSNTALTFLNCGDNQLTSLDVSSNTALTGLHCRTNQLTSLDVSANTALTDLDCHYNDLTSLDVSNNTSLTILQCWNNELTSLDVSANTALTRLNFHHNQLTSLDVSNILSLELLDCYGNNLTSLDVSNNTALTFLAVGYNQLDNLDVSNNTALTYLDYQSNSIDSLDVSNNTVLTHLDCQSNSIDNLDVSNNTALTYLAVGYNQLDSLDVSNNTALELLWCDNNGLDGLDISNNTALTRLKCAHNNLNSLDVSNNTALTSLVCASNGLTSLNVSNNTALTYLNFNNNDLDSLDISNNTALTQLKCAHNNLNSLDVSNNTALTSLECQANELTYLNMRNGITDGLTSFYATNNSLTCIETLDPGYATANWTYANGNIDEGVTFAVDCFSGPPPPPPFVDNAFFQTYGGSENDYGYSVQQTSDDGYIITGETYSYGNGEADVWLIKTDANGDTLWTQTYGGSESDIGNSVQQTSDDGYIIAGETYSYGNGAADVWLIKTDANGDTLWTQTFGGSEFDIGNSVQQTSDDGYIITGFTESSGNGAADVWLIKTNSSGVIVWTQTFGGSDSETGNSVQQTSDGGYIITGNTSSYGSGNSDLWLVKANFRGDSTWTKAIGGSDSETGNSVQQTSDDGYIIAGNTESYGNGAADVWLIKTDANGDTLWTQTFGDILENNGNSVQQTDDGGYIIAGSNGSLFKTDSNGNEEWNQNFGPGDSRSVQQTDDGGYIITGDDQSISDNSDVWLIKTDANGNLYSTPLSPLWYVATTGSDATGDGTEGNPFATIQTAIDTSSDGDSVLVAAGTYVENINIDKNIAVLGEDWETTIIDGDSSGSVVTFSNSVNESALLIGFTITNGSGLMEDDPSNNWDNGLSKGGGIYLDECSPILEQLIIENNTVSGGGGGISKSSQNSSVHISHSIIRNNTAKYAGAIHGQNGSNEITDCQIYNNHATTIGGGFGGVMTVSNSSIYNNTAVDGAAAMSADATMLNCVVSGNESPNYCIEIGGGSTEIKNTIIWGNTSSAIQCWSAITISYSDIEGGQEAFLDGGTDPNWGEGNIDADPLFCSSNSSLSFDGVDDYVDVGNVTTNFSSGLSVSAWVLYNSFNMWSRIIDFDVAIDAGQHNNILFANYDATNSLTFEVYVDGTSGGKVTADDALLTGMWTHLVASMDNTGNVILYKDGIQIHSGTTSLPAVMDRPSSFIGKSNWSWDGYFDGSIDEVAIWNSSLTALEVNALYNSGNGLDASFNSGEYSSAVDLVHYWAFNEGTGTTLTDQTSSGNNGTINGSTWITDTPDMAGGYTLAENSPCVGSGQDGADMGAYGIGCPGIMPPIEIQNLQLTGTITGLDNEGFDIVGNRLYTIFPGTNNSGDNAASLSIVNLNTLEILATGGEYSPTSSGFNSYPNRIEVFGNIAVVDGKMFFDVGGDVVQYLPGVSIPMSPISSNHVMHTYKRGNHLFSVLQSTGFGVFDMTDPLNPVTVYEHDYEDENDYPYGISANEDYIFIADLDDPTDVIHIHENGNDFSELGQIIFSSNNEIQRIAAHGNLLYTTMWSNILVYDISDPASPVQVATHGGGSLSNGEIKIVGNYLLIAAGGYGSDWDSEARIYDISDYQNLELVAEFNDSLPSYDIDWAGGKVYVAFGSQGNTDTWTGYSGGKVQVYESTGPGMSIIDEALPVAFNLYNAYPNPFNPVTTLRYDLPENGFVNIIIYDILGRRVKTLISQTKTAGQRSVQWNATNDYGKPVSAGVYLYQIQAVGFIQTKKMVLLK